MKILDSREIDSGMIFMPRYDGPLCFGKNCLHFFYDGEAIMRIDLSRLDLVKKVVCPRPADLPLPSRWRVLKFKGIDYLLCGKKVAYNIQADKLLELIPEELSVCYENSLSNEHHYIEDAFEFDDY